MTEGSYTTYFTKTSLCCLPSPLPSLYTSFLWLTVQSRQICIILLNIMDLNLSSLDILAPAAPCCVLCNKASNLLKFSTDNMVFDSTDTIPYTLTKIHRTHTMTKRLTHISKYILTQPVTCTQQLPILHWMKSLKLITCWGHISPD